MTSVQKNKGGTGGSEEARKDILSQMKVRTKFKTDKSWIHRQSSEDEQDSAASPISPQLKSLEGRKLLWSPTPESKPDRNSGSFTAKETFTSSTISPVQSSNKQLSYSSAENNAPQSPISKPSPTSGPSPTSRPSPPPSATASRPATSYIIRGQTLNAVSQVKSPPSFNGYQKSTVQSKANSLPRIQTAIGYKMSKDEYKKLAPYNVRNKSVDLSDDETPVTTEEQTKRTEQASSVLKSTTSKERSYVVSAAKRNSGVGTQESSAPFVAKRVEIEEVSPERKSQSLPKSLATYLYEDGNRFENSWNEKQSNQTPSQTSPPSATERSTSPRLCSYTVNTNIDGRSSPVTPEAGRITVIREESKEISKPPAERGSTTTTSTRTTITKSKEISKPPEEKQSTSATNTRTTKTERVEVTENKSETLPKSLASYLYDDASRFENKWKANQENPPTLVTAPTRVSERPESPKLISSSTEKRTSLIKPEPGKITVLRGESDTIPPKTTEERSSKRTVATTSENVDIPKLTSYKDNTETRSSSMQAGPGKITVVKEESQERNRESPKMTTQSSPNTSTTTRRTVETRLESSKESSDIPKLTSCSISKTLTESPAPIMQTGPGKISIVREDSSPPIPVPRTETKPKDTVSEKQEDLISWSDLESSSDNRLPKEKPSAAPIPVPRNINKDTDKFTSDAPLIVTSPELDRNRITSDPGNRNVKVTIETISEQPSTPEPPKPERSSFSSEKFTSDAPLIATSPKLDRNRTTQPSTPTAVSAAHETRYRVPESLDDPKPGTRSNLITSVPENRNVRTTIETIETISERPSTPEPPKTERSSSPRPSPRSRESTTATKVTETRYRVPETLEDTMLEASPARSSSSTTVTTTRSTDPVYTEYLEDRDTRSTRTMSSSREKVTTTTTTTVETQYDHASSRDSSQYDPQSSSNKGVLFVKEYVNTSENLKSPTTAGNLPDGSDMLSYNTNSSYLYSSAPNRSDEGPCTYCGREIKDCAKIMLEHLNICCHEYCFKCGICNKPMGDLIDSLFIHRKVVHCASCYEKLF